MKLSGICSLCGKMSSSPSTCMLCGAIVGDCCFRPAVGICKVCAQKARTQGKKLPRRM